MRYAEVIGDPVAQSKSPTIHKHWLDRLNLAGDYRRTHVPRGALAGFFDQRRRDSEWLGCNVTIPHKEPAAALVDALDPAADAIGAVNCVVPEGGRLIGYNTDVDGVAAALRHADIRRRKAAVIGAGGAARAVLAYLAEHGIAEIAVIARDPERATALQPLLAGIELHPLSFDRVDAAFGGASVIVNASPLGMARTEATPQIVLDALARHARGSTVFDMITTPAQTAFLAAGEAAGGRPIDGLTMLVGQAARAFALFYGAPAPQADHRLRDLLATDSANSA